MPIELVEGKLNENDTIHINKIDVGKVLINDEYPYALIKYLDDNFNQEDEFKSENATLKIKIPKWIN